MATKLKAQLKVSNFYGSAIARPYVLLDKEGKPVEDRVDAPQINDALIAWASKVPFTHGGALLKPEWDPKDGPQIKEARSDFQIFFQERFEDIHAANPAIFMSDRRAMLSAASVYWREQLTPEERATYRERAAAEKAAVAAQVAEAEESNPKLKIFREKLQKYKASVSNILSAAKVSTGPLWRVQRRLNAKYKLLDEQEAAAEEEAGIDGDKSEAASKKGGSKKGGSKGGRKAGQGRKAAASKWLVGNSDSGSSSEDEDEGRVEQDVAAAQEAAAAMQKLLLATAKKGGKPAASAAKNMRGSRAAATIGNGGAAAAEQEDGSSESEEEEQQQAQDGRRGTRSGAAVLAGRVGSRGVKGMYEDAFELPPSQGSTPANKARASSKAGKQAQAALPANSPGKRLRATRHSVPSDADAPVVESPAKKPRRVARKG